MSADSRLYLRSSASYFWIASSDAPSLGFCGGRGRSGVVATSTVKILASSRIFLRIGVVARQLWLFWPSTIRTLIGSAASGPARARAATAERSRVMGGFRGGSAGDE